MRSRKSRIARCNLLVVHLSVLMFCVSTLVYVSFTRAVPLVEVVHFTQEIRSKRIATADLHDGTRIDIPSIFMDLGHEVLNLGFKGKRGPYPIPLARMTYPSRKLSPVLMAYNSHSTRLSESMVQELFEYYKDDDDILQVDAFYCQFPPAMCELFLPFNRTIIINASHRLFLGRCSQTDSQRFVEHLRKMSSGVLGTRHFITANNVYDSEYTKYFTGLDVPVIAASSYGYQYCSYAPKHPEIIVGPTQLKEVPEVVNSSKFTFRTMKSLYGRFEVDDMCRHKAFVIIPYATHSYGIIEPYSLSIPMFAPSIEFALRERFFVDKSVSDPSYCGKEFKPPSWNSGSQPYSPEDDSDEAQRHWLQFAEVYQLPFIQHFDSLEHLEALLESANFSDIHYKMAAFNRKKRAQVYSQIHDLAGRISQRGELPRTFSEAVKPWGETFMAT